MKKINKLYFYYRLGFKGYRETDSIGQYDRNYLNYLWHNSSYSVWCSAGLIYNVMHTVCVAVEYALHSHRQVLSTDGGFKK